MKGQRLYLQTDQQIDPQLLWRILDVTRQLSAPIDLDSMLAHVIDAARDVLKADRGTVFLFDPKTDELYIKVATGVNNIRFPANRGIAGECAQTRRLINVPDCYADPRFNPEVDRKTGYRTRCLLTVPLIGHDDNLVGVMQVLNKLNGRFDDNDERIAGALAAQCAVALQRAVLLEEHMVKEKLERDLALAREIQLGIIPEVMPTLEQYDLAGWSKPADQTGGDIYDGVAIDSHGAMLLLCDATGHGIGPAISVTQVRAMFRMGVRLETDLDSLFQHINNQLCDDLASNRFVTAFMGLLDARDHQIIYHAGGQGPLLHLHAASGACDRLDASTFPMGIVPAGAPDRPAPIQLAPGDIFALVSDGVFEQQNPAGEQFNDHRVIAVIRDHQDEPMCDLIRRIEQAVTEFAADKPQADDMTIVLVKRKR